jgi:hypothetical protein
VSTLRLGPPSTTEAPWAGVDVPLLGLEAGPPTPALLPGLSYISTAHTGEAPESAGAHGLGVRRRLSEGGPATPLSKCALLNAANTLALVTFRACLRHTPLRAMGLSPCSITLSPPRAEKKNTVGRLPRKRTVSGMGKASKAPLHRCW